MFPVVLKETGALGEPEEDEGKTDEKDEAAGRDTADPQDGDGRDSEAGEGDSDKDKNE